MVLISDVMFWVFEFSLHLLIVKAFENSSSKDLHPFLTLVINFADTGHKGPIYSLISIEKFLIR